MPGQHYNTVIILPYKDVYHIFAERRFVTEFVQNYNDFVGWIINQIHTRQNDQTTILTFFVKLVLPLKYC